MSGLYPACPIYSRAGRAVVDFTLPFVRRTKYVEPMQLSQMKMVVTGAAQGMGRHFSLRLAEAGAQVAAGDVNDEGLRSLVAEAAKLQGQVHAHALDVTDPERVNAFVEWADETLGGVNGLINNAGIIRDGLLVKKRRETGEIVALPSKDWEAVIAVNLTGATRIAQAVIARMVAADRPGVIVNMSSISRHGNRGQSNYVAAKAAMAANTRTWALEFARYGIRVGAIAPGLVETPMTAGMNQRALDALRGQIPVGRLAVPEDIWRAVQFIIECDYFNGRTIDVDGGFSF